MADSKSTESQHVLDHVRRAENSIRAFHQHGTRSDGVLRNPTHQAMV
jgi:hypothetical protein